LHLVIKRPLSREAGPCWKPTRPAHLVIPTGVAICSASTSDQELKPLVLKLRGLIIRQGLVRDTRDVDKQP
jgi:hypothetical protein